MTTPHAVTPELPGPITAPAGARQLLRQQYLPAPLQTVFEFFADAQNLERITPPWMGFEILSELPIAMGEGTRIDYRIRLGGLPMRWRTRIAAWEPPEYFVDIQERGPYRCWEHLHHLSPLGEGTLMTDRVLYQAPMGPAGRAVEALWIDRTVGRIFDHRFQVIERMFSAEG